MRLTTNYGLKMPEKGDHYNIDDFNANFEAVDVKLKEAIDAGETSGEHISNKSNPHNVTKSQVGLGNVPNVATNDQTPTYTVATSNAALSSGEKLSVAFGKIAKAVSSLISHLANVNNPHSVTKAQIGLSNVPNVSTNDQTPTYTVASANAALVSGEKLSVAFGKIAKSIASLISHLANKNNPHNVTAAQVGATTVEELSAAMEAWTFTKNVVEDATALLNLLDNYSTNLANGTSYELWVNVYYSGDVILGGGQWKIVGNKATEMYEVQLAIQYTAEKAGVLVRGRSKFNGIWSPFVSVVTEPTLDNYVKNTGGTVNGKVFVNNSDHIPLVLRNTNTAQQEALIDFNNTYDGAVKYLGSLGFNGDKKPVYYNAGVGVYELLHTGNRPTGSYVGNGNSADRTIVTGGTGQVVCVTSVNAYTMAIVTPNGYIGKTGDDTIKTGTDAYMFNGTLVVRTTSELFNSNGVTYNYQVL